MAYNPNIHHRRSIRLKGYDYSQAGAYFITICCEHRICRFGKIDVGAGFTPAQMILNEFGNIAYNEWAKLAERYKNFELDVFQIMPNHMHGIIVLKNVVGAGCTPAPNINNNTAPMNENGQPQSGQPQLGLQWQILGDDNRAGVNPAPTIGDIVGAYKSLVANGCLEIYISNYLAAGVNPAPTMGKLWQRNYYENIIRNEQSYQNISEYIINNPAKWGDDKFYRQ